MQKEGVYLLGESKVRNLSDPRVADEHIASREVTMDDVCARMLTVRRQKDGNHTQI